jgi:N-hydroxyarylamine O-acetyltransferase
VATYQFPLDEYYARIDVPFSGKPTVDRLKELQRAQVYTIPFENLDIQLGRGIDLTPSHVDDKVIRRQRGGYCFELNGLFCRALRAAGFEVRPLLARVHNGDEPGGRCHQLSLVSIAGRDWIVDVGFGKASPRVPIPLEFDTPTDHDGTSLRLTNHELGYMLQKDQDGHWDTLYSFDLCPVVPKDIVVANYFTSTHPGIHFTTSRMAVLCHPEGDTRLLNYRCTTSRRGKEQVEQFPDADLYLEKLKQQFGIQLDATYDQLQPVQEDM